ncbi:MAG: hypothetical protein DRI46_07985 [Chloroflexi bacterium]|nr:MAG: hypothetical protein DRI46_07985 [Chloroflexota bacterium]
MTQELDDILFTAELRGMQYKSIIHGLQNSGVFEAIAEATGQKVSNEDIRAITTTVMIGIERNGPMKSIENTAYLASRISEAYPNAPDPLESVCKHLGIEAFNEDLSSLNAAEVRQVEITLGGSWKKIQKKLREDESK